MKHRRSNHPEIIETCKHFLKRKCAYEYKLCWYRHDTQPAENTNLNENSQKEYKCRFCESIFENKPAFMNHRKMNHPEVVVKCRDFERDCSRFPEAECWYNHSPSEEPGFEYQKSDFQKAQHNLHPPDLMQRIISMMELVMMKVEKLENTQNSQ